MFRALVLCLGMGMAWVNNGYGNEWIPDNYAGGQSFDAIPSNGQFKFDQATGQWIPVSSEEARGLVEQNGL